MKIVSAASRRQTSEVMVQGFALSSGFRKLEDLYFVPNFAEKRALSVTKMQCVSF